jgi:hypothetical protein
MGRSARLVAWLTTLAAAGGILTAAGGALPAPPVGSTRALVGWLVLTDPVVVALSVLRLAALLLTASLAALTLSSGVAPIGTCQPAGATKMSPLARRVLEGVAGFSLLTPTQLGSPVAAQPTPDDTAVLYDLDAEDPPRPDAGGVAVMRSLDAAPPPPTTDGMPGSEPSTDSTWAIAPGDHLWSVSRHTLHDALGRSPTDPEIAAYLARLVARNHDVLAVPSMPDLVFAGQVFVLPPVQE